MQQQEAADNLVKMLDLAPSSKVETLQPEFTPNPVLEVLKHADYDAVIHTHTETHRHRETQTHTYTRADTERE